MSTNPAEQPDVSPCTTYSTYCASDLPPPSCQHQGFRPIELPCPCRYQRPRHSRREHNWNATSCPQRQKINPELALQLYTVPQILLIKIVTEISLPSQDDPEAAFGDSLMPVTLALHQHAWMFFESGTSDAPGSGLTHPTSAHLKKGWPSDLQKAWQLLALGCLSKFPLFSLGESKEISWAIVQPENVSAVVVNF